MYIFTKAGIQFASLITWMFRTRTVNLKPLVNAAKYKGNVNKCEYKRILNLRFVIYT